MLFCARSYKCVGCVVAKEFVGREWELQQLKKLLETNIAQFAVIKGRRRIGKSRLIGEFVKHAPKNTTFVSLAGLPPTPGVTAKDQRDDFARQMGRLFQIPTPYSEDWGDLFWHLSHHTRDGRYIVLLDEISWMGMEDPTFLGKLKTAWDSMLKNNNKLILILCGSVSSWIEDNILKNTGFVGRIDLVLTLEELSMSESLALLGKQSRTLSPFELFKVLSVTGGVPRYLETVLLKYSAEENIKRLCFTKGGILFREFDQIFHDLFSTRSSIYSDLLKTLVAFPRANLEQIFSSLNREKSGVISHYLSDLIQAGFISRDYTWDLRKAKISLLSQYRISDNYVRFYLKYVEPLKEKIEKGDFNDRSLSTLPGWDTIMGLQFENMVIKNRKTLHQILGINSDEIIQDGPYFQRQTTKRQGCQIDYLIQTKYNSFTVCEIKFSKNPVGPSVVQEMRDKIKAMDVPRHVSCRPVLIHVNGVEDSVIGEDYFASIVNMADFIR
ncbi:MAG: hypothetical protein K0R76_1363 [Alphaproteobacteria bacterium]|nr:hypothetical protein [Alphaproteobacteria bacterium]